jgi:hypothetical protein
VHGEVRGSDELGNLLLTLEFSCVWVKVTFLVCCMMGFFAVITIGNGRKYENPIRTAEDAAPTMLRTFTCPFMNIPYRNHVSTHRNINEYVCLAEKSLTRMFLKPTLSTLRGRLRVDPSCEFFTFSFQV